MEQFTFLNQLPEKKAPQEEKPKVNTGSKFLEFPGHKEDVYESSINLANYLKEEKISNIMFLDKSARQAYVGLKEAWKKVGEDEIEPTIYFINPNEIRGQKDFSNYQAEFNRTYKHLNREEPILLYDACIHSGASLFSTKAFLESLGFTDIKLGVTSSDKSFPEERNSELDFIGLDHRAHAGCHPYGHPLYIERKDDQIVSQKIDSKMQRNRARLEHQKIKDVFKD